MLDTFIRKGGTKAQRRVRAAVSLIFFPVLLSASIVIGTLHHIFDCLREFVLDFKELILSDIPHIISEMVTVVKTGEAK